MNDQKKYDWYYDDDNSVSLTDDEAYKLGFCMQCCYYIENNEADENGDRRKEDCDECFENRRWAVGGYYGG